jgi:hypothetical protein
MARRRPTEPTVNPARGAALVVVAVLVGLFLLRNGIDDQVAVTSSPDDSSADGGEVTDGDDTATDEGTDAGTDDGATDDTTPASRPPAEVPTIVLNGSGVGGAAGRYSDVLAALGYQLTKPDGGNVDEGRNVPSTQILFAEGYEPEARAVATAIGAPSLVPAPLGATPPGTIVGAQVVVVLGPDLASVTPTTAVADTTDTTATTTG